MLLFLQTLLFFLAITFISYLAEVFGSSYGVGSICLLSESWYQQEFTLTNSLLRLTASGVYVLFRNRRILFKQG